MGPVPFIFRGYRQIGSVAHSSPLEIFSSPKPKTLSVTDVIEMLNKVNKELAGRELTFAEYLAYIEKRHGSEPIAYMLQRYSTMERMMDFISPNSQQQYQVERTSHGRLRIGGRFLGPELAVGDNRQSCTVRKDANYTSDRTNDNTSSSCSSKTLCRSVIMNQRVQHNLLRDIPYSTAFQHTMFPVDSKHMAVVGSFRAGRELCVNFTTELEQTYRDQLLKKLNSENTLKQTRTLGHAYEGMPCLALNEETSEGGRLYHRAAVISVESDKVCVYIYI